MNDTVAQYLTQHADRFVDELKEFLRIPTVSADPACKPHMLRGAEFVYRQFSRLGFNAEIVPTAGHPIVYAEWLKAPGAPTVLVYGHYDVQPADPLDLWTTPPFEPTLRDGCLYARGATDDKGQVFTHIKSAEAWLNAVGALPVNLKYVIEGEEEVGSRNLEDFLEARKKSFACDVAVVSDTSQYGPNQPAITYGLRGIVAVEMTLTGPKKDLHSGVFGGAVANPASGVARLIAALHDDQGRVQIPGFYDDVTPLTDAERKQFADLGFDEEAFKAELGVTEVFGEVGYSTTERRWARPTCEVNGLFSGYTGVGPKTIVPSKATVKITCRLVPSQDPHKIVQSLETFLKSKCPSSLTFEFTSYHGCPAFVLDPTSPYIEAASQAIREAWGVDTVRLIREGGSIPVVQTFKDVLGLDTLLLGWGQNTDNLHSPNEHFSVTDFHRGISASAGLWQKLAEMPK
ncbi:dipeptidase [Schlesneria paludicola]|uniref:dipeptidase n=1 Tax=Schlesneria paludicola TaxID=360056 RepID=UPI00029AD91E|nr:dipeptidase [Schlesneria paludicola]